MESDSYEWPSRFLDLKRELAPPTMEERLTASWKDLLSELAARTDEIAQAGPHVSLVSMCFAEVLANLSFISLFPKSTLQTWISYPLKR